MTLVVVQDQGGREYQEDRYVAFSVGGAGENAVAVYGVLDGHGGDAVSSFAAALLPKIMMRDMAGHDAVGPARVAKCVGALVHMLPAEIARGAGSTLALVVKTKTNVYVVNIGDSRTVIDEGDGHLLATIDHKPSEPEEERRIVSNGGVVVPAAPGDVPRVNGILALSRAIGDTHLGPAITWEPDIYDLARSPGAAAGGPEDQQLIVVATDGVWDVFGGVEVVRFIRTNVKKRRRGGAATADAVRAVLRSLVAECRTRGSDDNITIIVDHPEL